MDSDPQIDPLGVFDLEKNPSLYDYREKAINGAEFNANNLWGTVFGKHLFTENAYSIVKENPSVDTSDLSRMDLGVRLWQPTARRTFNPPAIIKYENGLILIGQGKTGKASKQDVATVEEQTFSACERFVHEEEVGSVWAFTYLGPFFRVWAYDDAADSLTPFFPDVQQWSEKKTYLDLKGNENRLLKVT